MAAFSPKSMLLHHGNKSSCMAYALLLKTTPTQEASLLWHQSPLTGSRQRLRMHSMAWPSVPFGDAWGWRLQLKLIWMFRVEPTVQGITRGILSCFLWTMIQSQANIHSFQWLCHGSQDLKYIYSGSWISRCANFCILLCRRSAFLAICAQHIAVHGFVNAWGGI